MALFELLERDLANAIAGDATLGAGVKGDATSLDPPSLNESGQLSHTGNAYEPLVGRDGKLGLEPALADNWSQP